MIILNVILISLVIDTSEEYFSFIAMCLVNLKNSIYNPYKKAINLH